MADQIQCPCQKWAASNIEQYSRLLMGHHPTCKEATDPVLAAIEFIREIVRAMEGWSADTDGMPPDVWGVYREAKILIGEGSELIEGAR